MLSCACPPADFAEIQQKRLRYRQHVRAFVDEAVTSQTMFLDIRYRILYRSASENVSLSLIQSQHQTLQMCFNKLNEDLVYVPSSGNYNFASVIGNPDVVFMPINHEDISEESGHIERINVPAGVSFGSSQPLETILNYLDSRSDIETTIPGVLNVYVARLENNILGQAMLESNVCCILDRTIGGYSEPASLGSYTLGKTTVHEVGHCLGLPHTFGTGSCSVQPFSDIPKQMQPNYDGMLFDNDGTRDGALDNRQRDCKVYKEGNSSYLKPGESPPYSCFNCNVTTTSCTECDSDLYEQFMNFMDYATDANAVMFSKEQSTYMRDWLLSGQTELTLVAGEGGLIPTAGLPKEAAGGNRLPVYGIILISIIWIAVAIIIAAVLIKYGLKTT